MRYQQGYWKTMSSYTKSNHNKTDFIDEDDIQF